MHDVMLRVEVGETTQSRLGDLPQDIHPDGPEYA
jgi:hypothetical protein